MTTEPPGATETTTNLSTLSVGVVVWLASELMFFAGLFAAYFTLRSVNDVWPPADVELATVRTAVATAVLVLSSGTMHLAVEAARHDDRRRAIRWLGVTALLGLVFLSNQGWEYAEASFQIDGGLYGCHKRVSHTSTRSTLRVTSPPTSTCTIIEARITYSYPVQA